MKTRDFNFELPQELIAQHPIEKRDASRLMVIDRNTGDIHHKNFFDVTHHLKAGDTLVLNNTRVMPARLYGKNKDREGVVEILLLKRTEKDEWETMVKPGKKAKLGDVLVFEDVLQGEVVSIKEDGLRIIRFQYEGIFENILDKLGHMPLPPYIKETLSDKERYQTVYSKEVGSAAAPTAGLHFTGELLEKIKKKGVNIAYITLHVGIGTFRPVKVDDVTKHKMHSEYYSIDEKTAEMLNHTRDNGGRIIAVGTTSVRTLETVAQRGFPLKSCSGWTDIFIYPPHDFQAVDGMITNFHLPESTLLMLVSAFAQKDLIMGAYKKAVEEKYRFFSFGDSMIII
ncbi:tRNA preQ1(34) S-adenosylmethionine ribosyltransferase-isomerase QueA [Alkalibacter saccharofermentans]|uniref:S-adenosylmethionine:tRNA ribosyltransferase-isomerase n=1 Tax=Alkalibacter saccharofermentans DSM 14828 TaxID=1120975 RepID=A0A1M4S484_9FIRM|nr:tRNA preQ1(34) S-adenosylmethionine ribosyltransferase-isomerase QueA [Alkalibacter saccharofermentans]SHE27015.1 S-adenosylmethionine--tRNA ribosyltransferase-isomerase [Alkalibacter saccharofermentans DSM 14828]